MVKLLFLVLGGICVSLGTLGIFVPILPTVPFYMVAAVCFAKGSAVIHERFVRSKLYRRNLKSLAEGNGMTRGAKLRIMGGVTFVMVLGFLFMGRVPVGRVILAVIWLFHAGYFMLWVKTIGSGAERTKELTEPESPGAGETH